MSDVIQRIHRGLDAARREVYSKDKWRGYPPIIYVGAKEFKDMQIFCSDANKPWSCESYCGFRVIKVIEESYLYI